MVQSISPRCLLATRPASAFRRCGRRRRWHGNLPTVAFLITLALCGLIRSGAAAETDFFFCPPVDCQDLQHGPGETHPNRCSPILAVLGTPKHVPGTSDRWRIEVEEVLYGDHRVKTVEFEQDRFTPRAIYFFTAKEHAEGYHFRYKIPAEEIAAARALCAARLTTLVLGSASIVSGREVSGAGPMTQFGYGPLKSLKVTKVHAGSDIRIGQMTFVESDPFSCFPMPGEDAPECLYLLSAPYQPRADDPVIRQVRGIFPKEQLAELLAARKRKDAYPLADENTIQALHYCWRTALRVPKGILPHAREVILEGTVDDAANYLRSETREVEVLGQRYLTYHPDEARALLLPLVEAAMLRTDVIKTKEFEWQERYIDTLARAEERSPTGALTLLGEKMIKALEQRPASVPIPERDPQAIEVRMPGKTERLREEDTRDTNHTLAWLIRRMDRAEIPNQWGPRLLALQKQLDGWWQKEVELAIHLAAKPDPKGDVAEAKPPTSGAHIRLGTELARYRSDVRATAFSPDGLLFATSSDATRIWSTADWHLLQTIPEGATAMVFAPDSKSLYLANSSADSRCYRYDWQAGRMDRTFEAPRWWRWMHLSQDGRTMLTVGDDTFGDLLLWDTETGKSSPRGVLPFRNAAAAFSSDGKLLARTLWVQNTMNQGRHVEVHVEPTKGGKALLKIPDVEEIGSMAFTPDGQHLITSDRSMQRWIALYKIGAAKNPVALIPNNERGCDELVVSPNGRMVAARSDSMIDVFSIPELKPLGSAKAPGSHSISGISFSPDSSLLVYADHETVLRVLRTDDFTDALKIEGRAK